MWILPALAGVIAVLVPPPQDATLRFLSERFALRTGADRDDTQLEILSASGALLRDVSVRDRYVAIGLSSVALVRADAASGNQDVELLDTDGALLSRFTVPGDRRLILGRDSVVLVPVPPEAPGMAYELDFRSLGGEQLQTLSISQSTLIHLVPEGGGQFLSYSKEAGQHTVRAFDPTGRVLWVFQCDGVVQPQARISPSGQRAVLWRVSEDRLTAVVHVLDGEGREVAQLDTPAVRAAEYSQDERRLVLAGWDSLLVIDADTSQVLWESSAPLKMPAGAALKISAQGEQVDVITVANAGTAVAQLRTLRLDSSGGYVESMRPLTDVERIGHVLGFHLLADQSVRLVTPTGQWRIAP